MKVLSVFGEKCVRRFVKAWDKAIPGEPINPAQRDVGVVFPHLTQTFHSGDQMEQAVGERIGVPAVKKIVDRLPGGIVVRWR